MTDKIDARSKHQIADGPIYLDSNVFDAFIVCKTCKDVADWHSECNGGEIFGCEKPECRCKGFDSLVIDGYVQYLLDRNKLDKYDIDPKHLTYLKGVKA
jgi:hypothetical protein